MPHYHEKLSRVALDDTIFSVEHEVLLMKKVLRGLDESISFHHSVPLAGSFHNKD